MTSDDIIELIAQLRAMARCEHEDMTVVSDAADAMHEMRSDVARYRAGLKIIVDADGFWDAPSLARDLLDGKAVT